MFKRAALLSLIALAACQPAEEEAAAPAVQLYAMNCGDAQFSDIGMFADDGSMNGQSRTLVVPCFLIRHPSGDLIWDTGFPDAIAAMPGGRMELPQMGATVVMNATLQSQLEQLGLAPADIEFVSFSHQHGDHTGNGNLFAASIWIVDTDERAYMFSDEARQGQAFPGYAQLEDAETRLIEGDADYDVFGDGSVVIVQTPGHTPGHTILKLQLANAGTVLLTGDMYHLAETRERRLVPSFNTDRAQTLASMDKVDQLAAATNARVVRQHVPEDFNALPRFPQALN
ncbi:MAG TPA: N-acyl homoserine lactonase family protein [Candidatus Binatia bacterium]|nr:N-acyl homoserine lactonase family protein [Candidatus Binatia bacterium]